MEYEIDKLKLERKAAREEVILAYMSSKSWAEFKVRIAAEGLGAKAGRTVVRACWLFWFRHMHPIAWKFLQFGIIALGGLMFMTALSMKGIYDNVADPLGWFADGLALAWLLVLGLHWLLHGKVFSRLQWLESLKEKSKKENGEV